MRVRRRSSRSRASSGTTNGRAANGRRTRTSGRTARRRRTGNLGYDLWREQARPAIRQAARDWQSSPLFDVAEEIRVEVRDQIRNLIPGIVLREVRGVLDDVTNPNRRRRTRTA